MKEIFRNSTNTKQILLSIIGEAAIGIVLINFKGGIVLLNQKTKEFLELPNDINTYLNENVLNLLEKPNVFNENIEKCITKSRFNFDLESIKVKDHYLNFKARCIVNGMLITIEDVTKISKSKIDLEKHVNLLALKNKELENFAYITSHDLQEPLLTIIGYNNLIQNEIKATPIPEDIKLYLNIINDSAQKMSTQIKGLLEYSRIGNSKQKEWVYVNEIIEEILQSLHNQITLANAQIKVNKLPKIKVFKTEFISLLQNIISNAIKYKRDDAIPEVEISAEKNKEYYIFSIKDNGIGIKEEFKDKIFEIFKRLHNQNKYKGSGIGLAYAKKIVNLHEGKIWFISNKEGKGVTFYFSIKQKT